MKNRLEMDLGDREAAEADRIPSPIRVAVSRRGPPGENTVTGTVT